MNLIATIATVLMIAAPTAQTVEPPTMTRGEAADLLHSRSISDEAQLLISRSWFASESDLQKSVSAYLAPDADSIAHREAVMLRALEWLRDDQGSGVNWLPTLQWLEHYRSSATIAHSEAAHYGVPAFPIRRMASGMLRELENNRHRVLARKTIESADLTYYSQLESPSPVLVSSLVEASRDVANAGLIEPALPALQRLATVDPRWLPLAVELSRITGDVEVFKQAARLYPGHAVTHVAEADTTLGTDLAIALWTDLLDGDSADLAAAAMRPLLTASTDEAREQVAAKLLDPDLGMAAALALSGERAFDSMEPVLSGHDELAANRVRIALSMSSDPRAIELLANSANEEIQ